MSAIDFSLWQCLSGVVKKNTQKNKNRILLWRFQQQKATTGTQLNLPKHMWIMDHFSVPTPHVFTRFRSCRAMAEESADIKLSMEWMHKLFKEDNMSQI